MTGTRERGGAPESVGDILPRVMREAGVHRAKKASGIGALWERAAGAEVAAETRPATLSRGVLTVEVRSASVLAELSGFRKDELLARVLAQDPSGRVVSLRFRLGVF